jgi:hypothetical protein
MFTICSHDTAYLPRLIYMLFVYLVGLTSRSTWLGYSSSYVILLYDVGKLSHALAYGYEMIIYGLPVMVDSCYLCLM